MYCTYLTKVDGGTEHTLTMLGQYWALYSLRPFNPGDPGNIAGVIKAKRLVFGGLDGDGNQIATSQHLGEFDSDTSAQYVDLQLADNAIDVVHGAKLFARGGFYDGNLAINVSSGGILM